MEEALKVLRRSLKSAPSLAPSNAVEPIEMTSSAIVPTTGASFAEPVNGTRSFTRCSSSRAIAESEPISPKKTPNASALVVHGSTP